MKGGLPETELRTSLWFAVMLTSQSRAPLFLLNLWVVWKVNVCKANQPSPLVTLFVMEPTNLYDFTWPLLHNLGTDVSWILATVCTLVLCFICKFNLLMLAEIEACICFVSYCTWAEVPFLYRKYLELRQPSSFVHKYGQQFYVHVTVHRNKFLSNKTN